MDGVLLADVDLNLCRQVGDARVGWQRQRAPPSCEGRLAGSTPPSCEGQGVKAAPFTPASAAAATDSPFARTRGYTSEPPFVGMIEG